MRKTTATCPITGKKAAWREQEAAPGEPEIVLDELPDGLPVGWGSARITIVSPNPEYEAVLAIRDRAEQEFEAQLAHLQETGQMGAEGTADVARAQWHDQQPPLPPAVVYVEWSWEDVSPEGMEAVVEAMKAAGIPLMTLEEAFPDDDLEDEGEGEPDPAAPAPAPSAEGEPAAEATAT